MNQLVQREETNLAPVTNILSPIDALIERAVFDKDFSVEKLEKMLEMKERHEANEARKAFTRAMSTFRAKCPSINKTERVNFNSKAGKVDYKHASLAGTIEQIQAIMTETGLSHSWRTNGNDNKISVTCIVTHELGHAEETTLNASSDNSGGKNAIQAIASTVSYLERYTLFAILGLASREMDDDGRGYALPKQEAPARTKQASNKPSTKQIESIVSILKNKDELRFYCYLKKASNEMQISVINSLPDKSNNKKLYREMEKNAANIVDRYASEIEGYAIKGDMLAVGELLNEIKPREQLNMDVYALLSDNCKAEIKNSIQE